MILELDNRLSVKAPQFFVKGEWLVTTKRPRIAIPGRFAETTSVTRYQGVVNATKLLDLVFDAGGEPLTMLPRPGVDWAPRLEGIDGVLLPGGSDVEPALYGGDSHPEVYGVWPDQDSTDLALATYVLSSPIPLLAICRGLQVVNVARGGTLAVHMVTPHRHHRSTLSLGTNAARLGLPNRDIDISCYHHQAISTLGSGMEALAYASEGHAEAVWIEAKAFAAGVQWHPEDNYDIEPAQLQLVENFIEQARQTQRQ
jgi:putative glutamine amidotransferase